MKVTKEVPLVPMTTLQIGGPAEFFVQLTERSQLPLIAAWCKEHSAPITIIGGGSNILVSDDGVRGLVVQNVLKGIQESTTQSGKVLVKAEAGESFDDLVSYTVGHGYWGLENLSHIPGSVGATPIQNVGAYGVEVSQLIESVEVFDVETSMTKTFANDECLFAYRDSLFKKQTASHLVITSVTFKLSTEPHPHVSYRDLADYFEREETVTQEDIRRAVIAIRSKKFPDWHTVGTAGSFFKNPIITKEKYQLLQRKYPALPYYVYGNDHVKIPLGYVLDKILNMRGVRSGNVGTYGKQALVLINFGGATYKELVAFADEIVKKVKEVIDVDVELEVTKLT